MSSANRVVEADGSAPDDPDASPVDAETVATETDRDPDAPRVLVVGGGQVGRLLARRLAAERPVHYVDVDRHAVERAARRHEATHVPDLTDRDALVAALDGASSVVVATPDDATNLLVVQHCRSAPAVQRVVVLVADPRIHDVYPTDVVRVCAATALVDATVTTLPDGRQRLAED
jgi:Trk K+ transport system NAD-binding subunit